MLTKRLGKGKGRYMMFKFSLEFRYNRSHISKTQQRWFEAWRSNQCVCSQVSNRKTIAIVSIHAVQREPSSFTCALWACRGYRRGHPTCSRDLWLGSIRRRPDHTAHTGRGWAGTHPPWSPQTTTAADERKRGQEKRRGGTQGSSGRGLQSEKKERKVR